MRKNLTAAVLTILCLSAFVCASRAQTTPAAATSKTNPLVVDTAPSETLPPTPVHPATVAQVKEYFAVTHSVAIAHRMMRQMADGMQATSAPYLTKAFWDDMRESFDHFDLEAASIPAYQRYISEEDMAQILAFYKTPAGQHILEAQPFITKASQEAVKAAAGQLGQEVYLRHEKEIEAAKAKYESGK
jgi:hypothetical protein